MNVSSCVGLGKIDNLTKVTMEALMADGFFHETTLPITPSTLG
jgi:hypothetical protein